VADHQPNPYKSEEGRESMSGGQQVGRARGFLGICTLFCMLTLAGCGGGGGGSGSGSGSGSGAHITGRIDDGLPRSPIANAVCRLVSPSGAELATTTADATGVYSVNVAPGTASFL